MGDYRFASAAASNVVNADCPHDCPDTCGMHIAVQGGVAIKVEDAKGMPFTQGALCTKVARYLDRTYSKERLLYPQNRVRTGVVAAPSVWWKKLTADGCNANEVTSQAIADMGGAATYCDCLVEVERLGTLVAHATTERVTHA